MSHSDDYQTTGSLCSLQQSAPSSCRGRGSPRLRPNSKELLINKKEINHAALRTVFTIVKIHVLLVHKNTIYMILKVIYLTLDIPKRSINRKIIFCLGSVTPEVFVQFPYLCLCHRTAACPSADGDGCNSSVNSQL